MNAPTGIREAGAIPLNRTDYERYALERSLTQSREIAAKFAGLKSTANLEKIENRPLVASRIAYLNRQEIERYKQKRERLETKLWDWLEVDRSEYYETVEIIVTDRNGAPICDKHGKPRIRTMNQLKPLEKLTPLQRSLIESISYTESGKPNLKLVSKQYCHSELRRMIGGDAQPDQKVQEWQGLSDREFFGELARMAYELGFQQGAEGKTLDLEALSGEK